MTTRRPAASRPIRNAYNPWARLAAAVLVQALREWRLWRTDSAVRYRSLPHAEQTRRYTRQSQVWCKMAGGPDPGIFLGTDTPYHRYLDVDPELLREMMSSPRAAERLEGLFGYRGERKVRYLS